MRDLLASFTHVQPAGSGWTARCPAHDDGRNSLSIGRGDDGRWLLKCHAGCELEDILAAAHLSLADLFPDRTVDHGQGDRRIVATYPYQAEDATELYRVLRYQPKDFRQQAPDGTWSIKGIRRVPYRLPELKGRKTVLIVEGEKDADCLWLLGVPASTNAGGAGKWRAEYAQLLKQAGCQHVIVLPDNDPPGTTHGLDVARSCIDAGLEVKLIPLPGLPQKGDVSDYLQHHSKDELLAIVRDAPLFDPRRLVTAPPLLALTSLADLLSEPDDQVDWLVEDRIPAGGVVLLVAAPKAGKSTLARELAAAVSRGDHWLGWRTCRGTVWLLIFQDKRSEVKKHFRHLGATGEIRFFINQPPTDLLPRLHALAEQERPALIVVDMLAGLLPVKDLNDYAQVTQRFAPLLNLSRVSGATLLLLHHGSAHGVAREGLDAALGSTALSGSVDNVLILRRVEGQRVLSSVQRIGPDMEPTIIVLNPETGRLERAGGKRDFDDRDLGDRILVALRTETEPIAENALQERVEGRKADQVRVLRRLLGMGKVHRLGAGGRKDPYRYTIQVPEVPRSYESSGSRGAETPPNNAHGREPQSTPANIDLFATFPVQVPRFPIGIWEQEQETSVRTSRDLASSHHDSGSLVPEVPEVPDHSEKPLNGTPVTAKAPDKHASISGSQTSETGPADECF